MLDGWIDDSVVGQTHRGVGCDTDLEPIDPSQQCLAESGVGVELESVIRNAGDSRQCVDLAGRFEHERPALLTHSLIQDRLRHLRVEVLLRVGALDHDDITGSEQAIEISGEFHGHSLA